MDVARLDLARRPIAHSRLTLKREVCCSTAALFKAGKLRKLKWGERMDNTIEYHSWFYPIGNTRTGIPNATLHSRAYGSWQLSQDIGPPSAVAATKSEES